MEELQLRMYALVHRSLSSIQKGIQAQHAITKFQREWPQEEPKKRYEKWADVDQTTIILDGGSHIELLDSYVKITNKFEHCATLFKEPDLNNCVTAVAFLLDERIFDEKKYPDSLPPIASSKYGDLEIVSAIYRPFDMVAFLMSIGGEKNYELRKFVKSFRLAI